MDLIVFPHLDEPDVRVLGAELDKHWRDHLCARRVSGAESRKASKLVPEEAHLAWPAPGGEEVHDDEASRVRLQLGPELLAGGHHLHRSSAAAVRLLLPATAEERREGERESPEHPATATAWR